MKFETISFKDLLSEIIDNRGKTCPTAEEGIPLIATNCVNNNTLYPTYEKIRFVSEDTYENWFRGHPEPGDILFVTKGSPGRCNFVPDPIEFCIAQDMVSIRADEDKIDPKFLFALLRSPQVQHQIGNMHVGSLIPHFKKGDFDKLFLEIPTDRDYQKKVGKQYFTYSQKIHLNQQTNETLEAMAQAIFKSWFVDFDPVRAKIEAKSVGGDFRGAAMAAIAGISLEQDWDEIEATLDQKLSNMTDEQRQQLTRTALLFPDELVESEIGEVPKGWEVTDLTECLDRISITYNLKEVEEVIFLNTGDIKEGKFLHNNYSKTKGLPGQAKKSIQKGDILYSEIRPKNKRFAYVYFDSTDYVVSTKLMVLRPKNSIDSLFYYQILKSESTVKELQFLAESRSGTFPQITFNSLKAIRFILPNNKEILSHFINVLKTNFERTIQNQKQNETLTQLRDTLLPKLISRDVGA